MKFYMKRNAGQPLAVGDTTIQFHPCEQVAGTWFGVYRTDDEKEIALLAEAAGKGLVQEIDRVAYDRRLQSRQRERTGPNVETAADYTPLAARAESAKPAEVESVETSEDGEVSDEEMNATASLQSNEGAAYIGKLDDLAAELGITRERLDEIRKDEGAPERTGKGYHVRSFREYLAKIGEAKPE